ncbi:MAG: hypothetical protein D6731_22005 [Planctomycetota bacterium]|nr:MAG: hypothetical protein D6731_22005 [Planctomycetota bacterium]
MIGHQHAADQYGRAHGFSVEISGGEGVDSNEGSWLTVSHSGLRFELESATIGTDQFQNKAIKRKHWGTLSLSGHLTKERNAIKNIYMQQLQDGAFQQDNWRTITVTWKGPDGADIHQVDFNECFLIDWSISELNSEEEAVPCIEYATFQVGYSENYLQA